VFGEIGRFMLSVFRCFRDMYEAYSDSKFRMAVNKKSSKVSYKILLLSDSTFFKLFSMYSLPLLGHLP